MRLIDSLHLHTFPCIISIIGAGGKTSTMTALAQELTAQGKRVLTTTTTHIGRDQGKQFQQLIIEDDLIRAVRKVNQLSDRGAAICLVSHEVQGNKYKGVPSWWMGHLIKEAAIDVILVEADGSKGRSFKAPGKTEPVIPKGNNRIILLIGIDALDKPIAEEYVHRPEIIRDLSGCREKAAGLSMGIICKVLFHREGLLKNINKTDTIDIIINKVDEQWESKAVLLAEEIVASGRLHGYINLRVLIGEVQSPVDPILRILE